MWKRRTGGRGGALGWLDFLRGSLRGDLRGGGAGVKRLN
jgi:hypothetical protein